jgi:hypothetical protein
MSKQQCIGFLKNAKRVDWMCSHHKNVNKHQTAFKILLCKCLMRRERKWQFWSFEGKRWHPKKCIFRKAAVPVKSNGELILSVKSTF